MPMQWETVFNGIAEGLIALDRRGNVQYANAAAAEALGCASANDLRNRPLADLAGDASAAGLVDVVLRTIEDERPSEVEIFLPHRRHWLAVRSYPAAAGVTVFLQDVTDRRFAEDSLRVSEAKFAGIVSISADAIISIDADHRIIHFNHGAEEVFGWTAADMIGQTLDALIPVRFRAGHPQHIGNFAASPVEARRMGERREISALRRNGEEFPAEASISKLSVGDQRIFTVVLRDVTERHRREENFRRLYEEAQRAVAARDDVLSFVSHDLGNPLAAIRISTAVLLRNMDAASAEGRHVAGIREAVNQAQRLIRDLLDVQRVEAGRLTLHVELLDVRTAIEEATTSLAPQIEEKSIRVSREVADHPVMVEADPDRMVQILANLISNAVKFSPDGGLVTVMVETDNDDVVLSVRDNGPGIDKVDLPHIFDRYFQAGRPGKIGHGLGLSIVQALTRAHGGQVWAESEPGVGSSFFVRLARPPAGPDPS